MTILNVRLIVSISRFLACLRKTRLFTIHSNCIKICEITMCNSLNFIPSNHRADRSLSCRLPNAGLYRFNTELFPSVWWSCLTFSTIPAIWMFWVFHKSSGFASFSFLPEKREGLMEGDIVSDLMKSNCLQVSRMPGTACRVLFRTHRNKARYSCYM